MVFWYRWKRNLVAARLFKPSSRGLAIGGDFARQVGARWTAGAALDWWSTDDGWKFEFGDDSPLLSFSEFSVRREAWGIRPYMIWRPLPSAWTPLFGLAMNVGRQTAIVRSEQHLNLQVLEAIEEARTVTVAQPYSHLGIEGHMGNFRLAATLRAPLFGWPPRIQLTSDIRWGSPRTAARVRDVGETAKLRAESKPPEEHDPATTPGRTVAQPNVRPLETKPAFIRSRKPHRHVVSTNLLNLAIATYGVAYEVVTSSASGVWIAFRRGDVPFLHGGEIKLVGGSIGYHAYPFKDAPAGMYVGPLLHLDFSREGEGVLPRIMVDLGHRWDWSGIVLSPSVQAGLLGIPGLFMLPFFGLGMNLGVAF